MPSPENLAGQDLEFGLVDAQFKLADLPCMHLKISLCFSLLLFEIDLGVSDL